MHRHGNMLIRLPDEWMVRYDDGIGPLFCSKRSDKSAKIGKLCVSRSLAARFPKSFVYMALLPGKNIAISNAHIIYMQNVMELNV